MRLGVYLNQYLSDPRQPLHHEMVEQARLAEAAGLQVVALGERHLHPAGFHELLTALCWVAAHTSRITIAAAGFIAPLYQPLYLATALANLDVLCEGRLIAGVVLGYRPEEMAAFGTTMEQRAGRMDEALEIITRLWRGEHVSVAGRYYTLHDAFLSPRPVPRAEHPGLPLWIGAREGPALRRAARYADGWVASYNEDPAGLGERIGAFRGLAAGAGNPHCEVVLMRDGYVGASHAEAIEVAAEPFLAFYGEYAAWKRASPDAVKYRDLSFERVAPRMVVGDAEECLHSLQAYAAMGVQTLILRVQCPGISHATTLRCLERLGTHIVPALAAL
jgi:alkanesulfonate monooxygenase SsuD/methylene tetrahydromethanopterin reductase-like flavin-dependent oxidoreductase (luciferase family)